MGMGYAANTGWVIDWDSICELCPQEAMAFLQFAEQINDPDFERMAKALSYGDADYLCDDDLDDRWIAMGAERLDDGSIDITPVMDKLSAVWAALYKAFQDATRVGDSELSIDICYHDQDSDGSRYDDVDGAYFIVFGVEQLTPAGLAIKAMLSQVNWVTFG